MLQIADADATATVEDVEIAVEETVWVPACGSSSCCAAAAATALVAADAIADAAEMTVAVSGSSSCFSAVAAALAAALAADATVAVDAIADADANTQLERISRCNKTIAISPVQQTVPGILLVIIYLDCS